jgi:hypothetical protein
MLRIHTPLWVASTLILLSDGCTDRRESRFASVVRVSAGNDSESRGRSELVVQDIAAERKILGDIPIDSYPVLLIADESTPFSKLSDSYVGFVKAGHWSFCLGLSHGSQTCFPFEAPTEWVRNTKWFRLRRGGQLEAIDYSEAGLAKEEGPRHKLSGDHEPVERIIIVVDDSTPCGLIVRVLASLHAQSSWPKRFHIVLTGENRVLPTVDWAAGSRLQTGSGVTSRQATNQPPDE